MGYKIKPPTAQYAEMGAEAALVIENMNDMTFDDLEHMLNEGEEEGACIEDPEGDDESDDGDGDDWVGKRVIDDDALDSDLNLDDDSNDSSDDEEEEDEDGGRTFVIEFLCDERPQEVYSEAAVRRTFQTAWRRRDEKRRPTKPTAPRRRKKT